MNAIRDGQFTLEAVPSSCRRFLVQAAIVALFFLSALGAQFLASGYGRTLGGTEDEPSHFLSALMMRDYFAAGLPFPPMAYAQEYYNHHPAFAIGYWPPLFYAVTGVWMLFAGFSHTSVLLMLAIVCALTQYLLYRFGAARFKKPYAFILAAAFPFIPEVTRSLTLMMSDLFLALWSFAATIAFAYFLEKPSVKGSILFGFLASAAIMTKSSGAFLILVPPIAILLSRRFDLLKRWALWIGVLIIPLLCAPWYLFASSFAMRGLLPDGSRQPILAAWIDGWTAMNYTTGPVILVLAIIGAVLIAVRPAAPGWYAIASQPLCLGIFLTIAPVFIESRYCIPAVPSVLLLSLYSLHSLMLWTPSVRLSYSLVPVLATSLFAAPKPLSIAPQLAPALDYVSRVAGPGDTTLVSSADAPEVLITVELAAREPRRPGRAVIRANRFLAASDWNTRWYRLLFDTPEAVRNELRQKSINVVLVSAFGVGARSWPHHDLLLRTLDAATDEWRLAYGAGDSRSWPYRVYVRRTP